MDDIGDLHRPFNIELPWGEGIEIYGADPLGIFVNNSVVLGNNGLEHHHHQHHPTDERLSEFFDFQAAAALDSGGEATSLVLQQPSSAEDFPRSISTPTNPILHAYHANYGPQAALPEAAHPPLVPWPFEHYEIRMGHHPTGELVNQTRKRAADQIQEALPEVDDVEASRTSKRTKRSCDQGVILRRVRKSCLRCHVQKLKCSEGRPCDQCQTVFSRALGTRTLRWTACISSKLSDLNIFALGIVLPDHQESGKSRPLDRDGDQATHFYLAALELMSSSGMLSEFDDGYSRIIQHAYGHGAATMHPFIIEERNPFHMLIQLNILLLGSRAAGFKVIGYVRFIRLLRATCAILSFRYLEKAFERTNLESSSRVRQVALLIQVVLLLDQVTQMSAGGSDLATCFSRGVAYRSMHQHLVQYVSYYVTQLLSKVFGSRCPLIKRVHKIGAGGLLHASFWDDLANLLPAIPLGRPPKIREFGSGDLQERTDEVDLEELYRHLSL